MTESLTPTESIAQSLLPYYTDGGKQARYLSYLMAGFSVTESVGLAKIHHKSVTRWRESDPKFVELEKAVSGPLREQLSLHLIDIEFTRNFRLVLAKDFDLLYKDAIGSPMTQVEKDYLVNIRKFYTPQQLAMIKQLLAGTTSDKGQDAFDFTRTVLEIRLSKEERVGRRTLSQMPPANED